MSLLERARAAQSASASMSDRSAMALDLLRNRVQRTLPVDALVALMRENPERARNELRSACRQEFSRVEWTALSASKRHQLTEELVDIVFGFGPLECLLADEEVTEIMVNGAQSVFYEKYGVLHRSEVAFGDDDQVRALIDRIIGPLGRRIDESSPMVSARLPQGHRVHAVVPPVAVDGPMLSIRTFSSKTMTLRDLERAGSLDEALSLFLIWSVHARINIAVSGGTGSGKTTLLNALSCHISHDERIITIEDSAELRFIDHPHVVRLEARPRNAEGVGEITIRDLLLSSLRMRPDRIIVGECRGGEALDMLQAMNTGHDGSLTTLHANSPYEAVGRLTTMVRYAADLPVDVIESHVASALDLIVQTARSSKGMRYVAQVSAVRWDADARRCRVDTLFLRENAQVAGKWMEVPAWLDNLVAAGFLDGAEVESWKRALRRAA